MINKRRKPWFWWILLGIVLAALFMLSAFQTFTGEHTKLVFQRLIGLNEDDSYRVNAFARKAAHVLIFGFLAVMFYKVIGRNTISYAWFCTVFMAVLDEWHQSFVPGRTPSIRDIFLDSFAALIFLFGVNLIRKRR